MTPDEKKLNKLEALIKLLDDNITKEDFVNSFEGIVNYIKKIETKTQLEVQLIKETLDSFAQQLKSDNTTDLDELKSSTKEATQTELEALRTTIRSELATQLATLKDGEKGDKGEKGDSIKGDPGSPDTSTDIRNKLETLEGDDRLDRTAIKGLDDLDERLTAIQVPQVPGGMRRLDISSNGVIIAKAITRINISGSGYTLVRDKDGTVELVLSGGGGTNIETPPEIVNGTNITFTVLNTPKYVIGDGVTYFSANGYTYSSGTITMTVPPTGFIRSIY